MCEKNNKKPPRPSLIELSSRLRTAFDNSKFKTQKELADEIGVRSETLWRYLQGQLRPSAPKCAKLARALNTSVEWILNGEHLDRVPREITENKYPTSKQDCLEVRESDQKYQSRLGILYKIVGELHLVRGYDLPKEYKEKLLEKAKNGSLMIGTIEELEQQIRYMQMVEKFGDSAIFEKPTNEKETKAKVKRISDHPEETEE